MELDWLKKKLVTTVEAKRSMIDPQHPTIPVRCQCRLLGLARSSLYDHPRSPGKKEDLASMRRIDEQYTALGADIT